MADRHLTDQHRKELGSELGKLHDVCVAHKFERAEARVRRLLADLGNGKFLTARRLHIDTSTLHQALTDDIQERQFYHYPKDKGLLLLGVSVDWAGTLAAFPSAEPDIRAAVDCYALGHNHASVYHCMMVLERGLPALADRLKAPIKKERPTWRDITYVIRNAIDRRRAAAASPPKGKKPLKGAAAKNEYDFLAVCGKAALEFTFFEHAWRNHIAHGRANYDENDAKKVLDHVRTFMEIIASKIKVKERK